MTRYGIIGKPLEHSYSAKYFTEKFSREHIDAEYRLYEIDDLTHMDELMQHLYGFNVTYPYKQSIMAHLRGIHEVAQAIGAVNVVCQGVGYNTDWIGFMHSIAAHLTSEDTRVLVLGTGGVSKAVQYALQRMGLAFTLVSRTPTAEAIGYDAITEQVLQSHPVIVNCTPLGMLPDIQSMPPIPYQYITSAHLLYDCVYNPERTAFLREGEQRGARTINGKQMLYLQADAAWEIWNKN